MAVASLVISLAALLLAGAAFRDWSQHSDEPEPSPNTVEFQTAPQEDSTPSDQPSPTAEEDPATETATPEQTSAPQDNTTRDRAVDAVPDLPPEQTSAPQEDATPSDQPSPTAEEDPATETAAPEQTPEPQPLTPSDSYQTPEQAVASMEQAYPGYMRCFPDEYIAEMDSRAGLGADTPEEFLARVAEQQPFYQRCFDGLVIAKAEAAAEAARVAEDEAQVAAGTADDATKLRLAMRCFKRLYLLNGLLEAAVSTEDDMIRSEFDELYRRTPGLEDCLDKASGDSGLGRIERLVSERLAADPVGFTVEIIIEEVPRALGCLAEETDAEDPAGELRLAVETVGPARPQQAVEWLRDKFEDQEFFALCAFLEIAWERTPFHVPDEPG